MGARKLKVKKRAKKTTKKAGKLLRRAADAALERLGGKKQLKQRARKVADAAASVLEAVAPKKK
jgi:hypothetical protein